MPGIMVVPFVVLRQGDIDGFSWPVSVQGKARLAANGHSIDLRKRRNAAMDTDRPTLRALLWCSATALQHLTRTMSIAFVLCLVAKHHSNAETVNITLSEYYEL